MNRQKKAMIKKVMTVLGITSGGLMMVGLIKMGMTIGGLKKMGLIKMEKKIKNLINGDITYTGLIGKDLIEIVTT